MAGFDNNVVIAKNVDFTQSSETHGSAQITQDGQLLIGSSVTPEIRVGKLGSSDSSITWTFGHGTITGQVSGGATVGKTITGNSGGALSPTAGNWNIVGSGSITNSGSGSTLTTQLTGLTNHNVLLGAGTSTITNLPPSATSGIPIISQGASADPVFGTVVVAGGGTGATSLTGILNGNGTSAVNAFVPLWYGTGVDGAQTFDGSSVVLGLTPSSSIYTLARDIFLGSSTINNGVTINTAGFRIYCNGTLTNNGTIKNSGFDGTTGGNGGSGSNTQTVGKGGNGGNGNTGTGSNGASIINALGGASGAGGAGGSSGGTAGSISAPVASAGSLYFLPAIVTGNGAGGGGMTIFIGGNGGGGGGGDGVNKGGGGGGGGGILLVVAYKIAGTGTMASNGGNGGNGAVGGTNCGGGGGGGGGVVIVVSSSVSGGAVSGQTITASAGTHGTGSGTGLNGSDGQPGLIIVAGM